jgi:hypothetical protein
MEKLDFWMNISPFIQLKQNNRVFCRSAILELFLVLQCFNKKGKEAAPAGRGVKTLSPPIGSLREKSPPG